MAILTNQGKHIMGILKKIKEYPDYKNHLPIITTGIDVFIGYIDYYFAEHNGAIADILFVQTIMPFPGSMGNHDYMTMIVDPNSISSITFDTSYYKFEPTEVTPVNSIGLDIGDFYRTLLRIMEYGCFNWGFVFRKYSLRMGGSQYASGLNSMNCNNDSMFSLQGNLFIPSSIKPITLGNLSSSYDDIKVLYIPTMYLNAIGAKLGIYPDGLLEFFDNLIHERKLSLFPISWLTANERRKALVAPYALGQTVYSQKLEKSFISLIPDNIEEPSNTKAWKEINYKNPSSTELIPESISNPVDELLALFG